VDDLKLAFEMGTAADQIALPFFYRGVKIKKKADGSALTEADLAVERHLLEVLASERPGDAVLSEECGVRGASRRTWILDPIDGTTPFAAGLDTWGTHVALEEEGELVLGLITRPVAGQCWWAVKGQGAYRSGLGSMAPAEKLQVSDTADSLQARIMVWAPAETPLDRALKQRGQRVETNYDGVLDLLSGRIDALADYIGQPWDLAPAVLLVEEAGGRFVDWQRGHRLDCVGGWFSNRKMDARCSDFLPF
jgi:histidinol-phosphatase